MSLRVALVTGAAQGIGEAIAIRLADDPSGIDVAVSDVKGKEDLLNVLVKRIEAKGRKAMMIICDVSSEEQVQATVETTVEVLGSLDIMVANAGIHHVQPLIETTVDSWNRVQSVNILGVMLCYKYAALQMIKQGRGGRIIGATSVGGKRAAADMSAYCASKFAVRGLTQSAALELRKHQITVNCYAPGVIHTPMIAHPDDEKNGGIGTTMKLSQGVGLDFPSSPPDVVAELVAYFIKPEAHFTTGQSIVVDGGALFFD